MKVNNTILEVSINYDTLERDLISHIVNLVSSNQLDKPTTTKELESIWNQFVSEDLVQIKNYRRKPTGLLDLPQAWRDKHYPKIISELEKEFKIYPVVVPQKLKDSWFDYENPNLYKFISCTKELLPNLSVTESHKSLENLIYCVNALRERLFTDNFNKQVCLWLCQPQIGGGGKGIFMNILNHWCQTKGICSTFSSIESQYVSKVFNENAIVFLSDVLKKDIDKGSTDYLNDIIDGSYYGYNIKFGSKGSCKSQSFLVVASNFYPTDDNIRRYKNGLVMFASDGEISENEFNKYFKTRTMNELDYDYYDKVVDEWIKSCPYDNHLGDEMFSLYENDSKNWVNACSKSDHYTVLQFIAEMIKYDDSDNFNIKSQSSLQLNNRMKSLSASNTHEYEYMTDPLPSSNKILNVLKGLESARLVKKLGGNDRGAHYDLSKIAKHADIILRGSESYTSLADRNIDAMAMVYDRILNDIKEKETAESDYS